MRALVLLIAALPAHGAAWKTDLDIRIPMRDGVRLSANVFRPAAPTRLPAILIRTPYGKGHDLPLTWKPFVDAGYALVIQDVRGRYASAGTFRPLDQEPADGYDTLSWLARQPWCDGNLAMAGGSYLGIVQWKLLPLRHPNLKAVSPIVSGFDDYRDRFYSPGGALKLGHRLLWVRDNYSPAWRPRVDFNRFIRHLPLRTIDREATGSSVEMVQQALDHPLYDGFWQARSVRAQASRITTPVLSFGGWYDNFAESDLEAFATLAAAGVPVRTVIGPWPHNFNARFAGADFGSEASLPIRRMQIEWFDHWLRAKPLAPAAPLRLFVMGANRWLDARAWPPEGVRVTDFYLRSAGRLGYSLPKNEPPDAYTYDPRDPVPTRGGAVCCNPEVFPWGPLDQRDVEARRDVLVYSTDPLKREVEIAGPVKAVLWVSSSAPDTDFTAKLVDVAPAGEARNLCDGILRLRYRAGIDREVFAKPGELYRIEVPAGVTAHRFLKGHRIRVEVSSSNFPKYDRNPNTGRRIADETRLEPARQAIFHDRRRASYFALPVVAASKRGGSAALANASPVK